ncbi:uncharacterized protein LOC128862906 isoform X3 [Anastrepha ludens]|uniref:uncharacterized protein LOC128862906 isoform X3 n=1 Tax=Anastrepha ludens TaxID=28586 RepID=UPI0023AF652C|nr:uncharacterized protein LOC128862906 isoform X3 [Anastrepha ludens]
MSIPVKSNTRMKRNKCDRVNNQSQVRSTKKYEQMYTSATKKMERVVASMERPDAPISSKPSDYGSTTLKNRAPPTYGQDITAEIRITSNECALDSNEKSYDHDDSDHSVGHHYSNSSATDVNDITYQSLPIPATTYTSSLFAAACSTSSASRFQTRNSHSRHSRYAYSRMETYIDESSAPKKSKWNAGSFQRFETFLFVVNQMCIGFVTIYMSFLCITNGLQQTPLHAWLVTLGYSLLTAEGVMVHFNANPLTSHYKRHEKHTIHWVLQVAGGGLGMGGTMYKCIQKGFMLTSTHGKLGFTTFIFCLISWLSGLSALYQLKLKSFVRPLFNRTIHNLLGLTCFVLALVTQFFGYQTGFFSSRTTTEFQYCIKTITLLSLVLTCIGPIKALLQKARTIIKN